MLTFVISHAVPADPVAVNLGEQAAANPQTVAAFRHQWGLDRPLPQQYLVYVWRLVHGDMGVSISTHQAVATDLGQDLPATVELAFAAMVFSLAVGIPLGILAGARRDTAVDQISRSASLIGVSMPVFWLGLVALLVFYAWLGWAPSAGQLSPRLSRPPAVTGFVVVDALLAGDGGVARDALSHLVLPALVLSAYSIGVITRMMRGSMLDVLGEDYVRTARAKGLPGLRVTLRHAARNALLPVITIVGLSFGGLLSGAVITETVFAWPGVGTLMLDAILRKDYPVVLAAIEIVAGGFIVINMSLDLLYGYLDPRLRVART